MKLNLRGLRDHAHSTITTKHVDPSRVLTVEDLKKKKEHNQTILEIAFALSYVEFYDIKIVESVNKIWVHTISGGYKNILGAKFESLKRKFDDMRMQEGENIAQYCSRIKYVVNAIRGSTSTIDDVIVLSNILRALLHIYAIRVSVIQELRCILGNTLSLEGLVGRLTTFELSNFDNYKSESTESSFKVKLSRT